MDAIEKRVLEFVALATPLNDNRSGLVLAPQARVDELLTQLNGFKARGTVHFTGEEHWLHGPRTAASF